MDADRNGASLNSSFKSLLGICTEGNTIFITDPYTGQLKMISDVSVCSEFLEKLALLHRSFGVLSRNGAHLPSLDEARRMISDLINYLNDNEKAIQNLTGLRKKLQGPEGHVSHQTVESCVLLHEELGQIAKTIKQVPSCEDVFKKLNLLCLTTLAIESQHAVVHFKTDTPTPLEYMRNLSTNVHEAMKRVCPSPIHYYTHPSSYYPVPESMSQRLADKKLSRLSRLEPKVVLDSTKKSHMRDYCSEEGRAARQLSVRQQNTKFKAGTLPISTYSNRSQYIPFVFTDRALEGAVGGDVENTAMAPVENEEATADVEASSSDECEDQPQDQLNEFDPSDGESDDEEELSLDNKPKPSIPTIHPSMFFALSRRSSGRAIKINPRYFSN